MLLTAMPNVTNDFMQGMLMGSSDLKYETKVQKLKVWTKLTMVMKVQSWEMINKNWMKAIQIATMTVKKRLMIWTYKFGNYP